MKKVHIAISTNAMAASIADYSARLGTNPCSCVAGEYALWRTETLNLSVRYDCDSKGGELGHLGWEDATAEAFSEEKDVNGISWELFSAQQQADEINQLWPETNYQIKHTES